MSRMPRLIPLTAVAIGGVLAINAITHGPALFSAAKAFAEDAAQPDAKAGLKPAVAPNASLVSSAAAAKPAAPVCAPTAAELAKEAGLSPAELQVLQSLGNRRGELDQRESDLDTQVQLIAAAEAKLDSRIKEMNGLKTDIQGLLSQADQQQEAETGRLVKIYEAMDPKAAALRMANMADDVRLPIAAKMKERKLADIFNKMDPEAARIITEKLAHRIDGAQAVANARSVLNPPATTTSAPTKTAQAAPTAQDASATPRADGQDSAQTKPAAKPHRVAKARPRRKPAGTQVAAAKAAPSPAVQAPAATSSSKPPSAAPAPAAAPSPPPAKTG